MKFFTILVTLTLALTVVVGCNSDSKSDSSQRPETAPEPSSFNNAIKEDPKIPEGAKKAMLRGDRSGGTDPSTK